MYDGDDNNLVWLEDTDLNILINSYPTKQRFYQQYVKPIIGKNAVSTFGDEPITLYVHQLFSIIFLKLFG